MLKIGLFFECHYLAWWVTETNRKIRLTSDSSLIYFANSISRFYSHKNIMAPAEILEMNNNRYIDQKFIFDQKLILWTNFQLLTKNSTFDLGLNLWPNFQFCNQKFIFFVQIFNFSTKNSNFLTKILYFSVTLFIFYQKFDFWAKYQMLDFIYQNFNLLSTLPDNISISSENIDKFVHLAKTCEYQKCSKIR